MNMKLSEVRNWTLEIENEITKKWVKSEKFRISERTRKKIYSIDTPPPYVNSPVHIAQAVTYCYMDFFARYKRMKGFDVLFPLGLDRNGLPIEMAAEKKFKVSPFSVGREEFIKKCEQVIDEGSVGTQESFAKLGISFTSYKEGDHLGAVYKTDSSEYRKLTQDTFIDLYKKGFVYEASRINNWDPKLRTTIADSEIIRVEKETDLNFVKFKLSGTNEFVTIATTRPELLCTSALIIFNPKDDRYKKLKGKKAVTPVFGNEVEIIAHEDADPEFGTGLVFMSSSGGDQDAVRFLRKVGVKPISAVGIDGKMNEHGGVLEGLKTKEARKKVIELLKEESALEKQERLMHSVPISERSGAEIEFVEMPEFYLKQKEFVKDIKKISNEIKFYPKESKKILNDWLDSVAIDWPISRRRFYATPIPLWYSGEFVALPPKGKYYGPWKEDPPKDCEVYKNGKFTGKKLKEFDLKWEGETRVFDTWMDSSISELAILKYGSNKSFFEKAFPASLRPQGKEIVRTWLYYTLLRGYLETGKQAFENVWIHQHLTDEKGRKMSKSLGNVIDPKEVVNEFGAEALRFWASVEGDLSKQDLKVSKQKIGAERKTINKIINVAKFISLFEKPKKKPRLAKLDEVFISYIEEIVSYCDKHYENYDFYNPSVKLRNFLWEVFASNYLEIVKARVYESGDFTKEESLSAKYSLYYIFEKFIQLTHPVIPQVTSFVAENLGFDLSEFPEFTNREFKKGVVEKIMEFNSKVWKEKKDKKISLKDGISGIKIPKNLKDFEKDLKACHGLV
jgi:valyl-tRNA synthetase